MGKGDTEKKVHAPYNFVPFSGKIIKRYEDMEELPDYGKIDPDLKTGEIHVTLETQTPLYISNGKEEKEEDFFKGADGKYQIPGASVRGMLRENMQILGFGLIRPEEDIADYQIYFRDMTSARDSVKSDVKEYYKAALDIETKKAGKKSVSIPKNVKAGYLHNENGQFYITPTRYIRVSRKNPGMYAFMKNDQVEPAVYKEVAYTEGEDLIKEIVPLRSKKTGMKEGILLSTGKPVNQKNHLYVFEKEHTDSESIDVAKEDIISYREDWENRQNSLKAYYNVDFWKVPENGEVKPVFYIEHNGHLYFGMSLFLRIGYPHSISEGLPDSHKKRIKDEKEQEKPFRDYPYAMLGFARDHASYRSRISVGDFHVAEKRTSNNKYSVIGADPKPSYYAGYIKDGKSYAEETFSLRGYKQYWMRENIVQPPEIKNKNMGKQIHPVEKKTLFKGTIRFRNLHDDELGLLLWALQLEEGCYQSLGMGKPYGFGRVKVTIDELAELKPSEFYSLKGLTEGLKNRNSSIEEYIERYKKYASEKLAEGEKSKKGKKDKKKAVASQNEIKDFIFIHKISPLPEAEMSYMDLSEYGNETEILKPLSEYRKEQEEKNSQKTEESEAGSMEDLIAMMNKRFK